MLTAISTYRRLYQRLTKGVFRAVPAGTATSEPEFKAFFTDFALSKPDFRAVLTETCPSDGGRSGGE